MHPPPDGATLNLKFCKPFAKLPSVITRSQLISSKFKSMYLLGRPKFNLPSDMIYIIIYYKKNIYF